MKEKLTCKMLKEVLNYNPHTGEFIWKESRGCIKKGAIANNVMNAGYIHIQINGNKYLAHRLAWLYMLGEFPKDDIDHINHNRVDNRIENLRSVTRKENSRNQKSRRCSKSGISGVQYLEKDKKWVVRISVNYKNIWLGTFDDKKDAVEARKLAKVKYCFHNNHGEV